MTNHNKNFKPIYALLTYVFLISALFFIHRFFVDFNTMHLLYWCYGFNAILTFIYLVVILYLGELFKDQIGFVFLGVATLKIGLFLAIKYLYDLEIESSQFLIFFVPYFFSVIIEILITKRILDNLTFNDK